MRVDERDERCVIMTIDPLTRERDPSVLRTLAQQRDVCIGVYGSTVRRGSVALGDAGLARRSPRNLRRFVASRGRAAPLCSALHLAISQRLLVEEERGPWRHGCSIDGQQQHSAIPGIGSRASSRATGELLTRVARSYSLCADDAQDAVQRAFEIYMRRVASLDPATELAWLKVVVKHEALAVRRGARRRVAGEEFDLDAVPAVAQRSVEERLESAERVERSAEVMRRLKRDEARALMLKAEGLSYVEIGERLGWTYTKVISSIALFVALGGTSYALTLPRNSVGPTQIRSGAVGPISLVPGAVRSRDVKDRSLAVRDLSRAARSSLRGGTGPVGPPGPPGSAGINYRAAINSAGGQNRGNAISSEIRGLNEYLVGFDRNIDDCVTTATLANVPGGMTTNPPAGRITISRESGRALVKTYDAAGNVASLPFHLIVAC